MLKKADQNEHLKVEFEGKTIYLNGLLIERQEVDEETVQKIKDTHFERLQVLTKMEKAEDRITLRLLNESITELDFTLQKLWGFPLDANYHRWWEVPQCKCPHFDNIDRYGTKYRVTRDECPIHGKS